MANILIGIGQSRATKERRTHPRRPSQSPERPTVLQNGRSRRLPGGPPVRFIPRQLPEALRLRPPIGGPDGHAPLARRPLRRRRGQELQDHPPSR